MCQFIETFPLIVSIIFNQFAEPQETRIFGRSTYNLMAEIKAWNFNSACDGVFEILDTLKSFKTVEEVALPLRVAYSEVWRSQKRYLHTKFCIKRYIWVQMCIYS